MSTSVLRRATTRLAALLILGGLAACDHTPTAPAARRIQAARRSADGDPPDAPCKSGWHELNGEWVCGDP